MFDFFTSLAKSKYLSVFSLSGSFGHQTLSDDKCFLFLLINIERSVWISKSQRISCVSFSWTDYHYYITLYEFFILMSVDGLSLQDSSQYSGRSQQWWSRLVLRFQTLSAPWPSLLGPFQVHQLQLVSPSPSCSCPVGWGCKIHRLQDLPDECPGYDTKQSDGEVAAVLELWGMRSTPSLPSLPGPLWPGVVAPDRALSMR